MKDAWNEARVEANLHAKTSKALGVAEQKGQEQPLLLPKNMAAL